MEKLIIQFFLYFWLIIALIITTITDVYQRRIPNLITYSTIFLSFMTYFYVGGFEGLRFSASGLVFGFLVFFLPYLMGGMGAGDVKLMSAVGSVLGYKMTIVSALIIAICGGILAIGFSIYRRNFKHHLLKLFLSILYLGMHNDSTLLKIDNIHQHKEKIPYGVAIASGVFLLFSYLIIHEKNLPFFQIY